MILIYFVLPMIICLCVLCVLVEFIVQLKKVFYENKNKRHLNN